MSWIVTEGNEYADVHSNSGELTYGGNDSLCGGIPENTCDPYAIYSAKTELEESRDFDPFDSEYNCGKITKNFTAKSCNQDMLIMWFNQGDNKEYPNVLDDNSIFDIKNVDECEHIIISEHNIRVGNQKFDDSGYTDSGYPCILTDPCDSSSECKYVARTTYQGHKIKYHTINDTIPHDFYKNHNELVELYFPHMYYSDDDGMNTRIIGNSAFYGCKRLSAITFSAVEEIGNAAFCGCTSLKLIDWGHTGCCDSEIKRIHVGAFQGCESIEKLCLGELKSVEAIQEYAFEGCSSVTYLTLPSASAYTAITNHCFENVGTAGDGIPEIIIPHNIKKIEEDAFRNFKFAKGGKLDIGAVEEIGNAAFWGCTNTCINLPNSLKTVYSFAFTLDGTDTVSLYIPSSVSTFGLRAFTSASFAIKWDINDGQKLAFVGFTPSNQKVFTIERHMAMQVPNVSTKEYFKENVFDITDVDGGGTYAFYLRNNLKNEVLNDTYFTSHSNCTFKSLNDWTTDGYS